MIDYEIPKTLKKALYSLMPSKLILQTGYPSSNKVYLTFDDGPYGELTQQTLKYLKEENILATFFVTGEYLKRHPDIILQTLSSGHEIGNHTFSHPQSTHCDVKKTWMELLSVNRMISQLTGALPKLIRPPYGKITVAYLMFALVFRQTIVLWSFDSNDSFILQDQQFLDMIESVKAGDIILLHDDKELTVRNLKNIIAILKNKSLQFGLVSELLPY